MKRLFWGFIKIALIAFLLVWASRALFPDTTHLVENEDDVSIIVDSAPAEENIQEEVQEKEQKKERVLSLSDPVTAQQKQYVDFSLRAGMPTAFTQSFTVSGYEPLSLQIARLVGEPLNQWTNHSLHKKTFWILAELTLQGINVDSASSFNGGIVTINNGNVLVDSSAVVKSSFSPTRIAFASAISTIDSIEIEIPVPTKKTARRMSVGRWEQVLQSGAR